MKKKLAILIVEDDPEYQFTLTRILAGLRDRYVFIIEATYDNAILRIQDPSQRIGLALVDIILEDSGIESGKQDRALSGLEVLVELRDKFIPSIAISAYQDSENVRDAFIKGGTRDFWFKDIDKNTYLLDAVRRVEQDMANKPDLSPLRSPSIVRWLPMIYVVFAILSILIVTTWVPETDRLLAFTVLIALVIVQGSISGLLLRRLTGKDFREIISLFKPRWPL